MINLENFDEDEIYKNISGWIKRGRIELGLTQQQFGDKVGVQKSRVSKWETGKERPTNERLEKICDVIGIDQHIMVQYDCNEYETPLRVNKGMKRYDVGLNSVFNSIHNISELKLFFEMAFSINLTINDEEVNKLIITADEFEGKIIEYSGFPITGFRFNEDYIEFGILYTDIDVINTEPEDVENLGDKISQRIVTIDICNITKIKPTYNEGNRFYLIDLELKESFELGGRIIRICFDISDSGDTLEYEDNQQL